MIRLHDELFTATETQCQNKQSYSDAQYLSSQSCFLSKTDNACSFKKYGLKNIFRLRNSLLTRYE